MLPDNPLLQELKGNIRVFCRVRPASNSETLEALPGQPIINYNSSGVKICTISCFQKPVFQNPSALINHLGAGDMEGCGLELATLQNGKDLQQYSFGFDKVFPPSASQVRFHRLSPLLSILVWLCMLCLILILGPNMLFDAVAGGGF